MTNRNHSIQNMLANAQFDLQVAAYTKVPLTWKDTLSSPYNRLYYIKDGEGMLQIEDEIYYPRPGQLFLLPADTPLAYSVINNNPFTKFWCHFTAIIGDTSLFRLIRPPAFLDVEDEQYMTSTFEQLIYWENNESWTASLRVKALLIDLICYYLERTKSNISLSAAPAAFEKIDTILQYIDLHLSEEITVEQLARLVHYHPNYFIKFFRGMVGTSPIQYIMKRRMDSAKALLLTDRSISVIASEIGMQLHYFSRTFKAMTGLTPTEYRGATIDNWELTKHRQ